MSFACILARNANSEQGTGMSEERFIDIETRLAHQDQLLDELNDVLTEQQAKIMELDELCKSLIVRIRSLDDGITDGDPGDEKPPHY